jgi:hypothetical protein
MKNLLLLCQLLVFTLSFEGSESECFQTRDGSTCDLNSLSFITENLRAVFKEIYGSAPVDFECIKLKSSDEEMNLALSIVPDDDKSDDVDKSEALLAIMEQLFELMRSKVMSCYDSEVFVERLMMMYERMQNAKMKNCIGSIVSGDSSDPECFQVSNKLYAKFSIDELFLDTPSIVQARSLSYEARKCIASASNKESRLLEVLKLIVNEKSSLTDEEKKINRQSFKKFYEQSLTSLSKCFKTMKSQSSFFQLTLINVFDSVIKTNLTIATILLTLMILTLFVKLLERRGNYAELT